ncbi:outer membrane protein assembly factor BamB family protein [Haloplanus aerogenes]|uniref:Putative pyrroloquinoline-quinone binding quinoprotein n=1 Tax=Haloplanus aerogenes TaxID=660522 RepID=A0A3M0CSN5_9EURY|nr:PQQ-binding-like beta-propeller repeat protein [Haloplanus aerogenes]AZH26920.1 hypothetical protein DU502_16735 [Haloplanus aerogenes]RMB12571.1 putative pyrroloquinoline-quinone binding quinoprotein [Haloplanus aerogenes]
MLRRRVLALLGSTATTTLSGCLFGGFGASESGPPETVTERPVTASGSIPQYQVDAENTGILTGSAPADPSVAWRRTPSRYDAAQPVVDGDAVYVAFDGDLVKLSLRDGDTDWTVWEQSGDERTTAAPTVADQRVVVADGETVRALDDSG